METLPITATQETAVDSVKEFFEAVALNFSERIAPTITDSAQSEVESKMLSNIKATAKAVKEKKDFLLKPFKDAVDQLNSIIRPAEEALKNAEKASKDAILTFADLQRRRAEESARRQQEEENKAAEAKRQALAEAALDEELFGNPTVAQELVMQASEVAPAKIGVVEVKQKGERTIWDYEITDVNLIPREYLAPNLSLIGSIVKGSSGNTNIPGIKLIARKILASK